MIVFIRASITRPVGHLQTTTARVLRLPYRRICRDSSRRRCQRTRAASH
ncbi:MAG: hypothetical protein QM736_16925 [Vicinamibacterales bacterium]